MRSCFLCLLVTLSACQTKVSSDESVHGDTSKGPGWASVFQTSTSETETIINILRPRLSKVSYLVEDNQGAVKDSYRDQDKVIPVVQTTQGPSIHWAMDRIHIKDLAPKKEYRLLLVNNRGGRTFDWRVFKTMDLSKKKSRFIVGSCMSDSHAFEHVRKKIWPKMLTHDPDFIMLLGDEVYVDDFGFVKRNQATEFDLWTRYIDSFRKVPLFHGRRLIPIMAVWDDHDFGTNNSDKTFKARKAAEKVFNAFFGGTVKGPYQRSKEGVYFSLSGFGQKFLFMDNRYFREPSKKNPYGQWGKKQHAWFQKQLAESPEPIWLANGGQFFTKATYVTKKNGDKKQINETFVADHPKHFQKLLSEIKMAKQPVVFLSGDIHYSEVARVEKELLGYETYEITSSPVHSFIFRSKKGPEKWLDNPRRMVSVKEHNYLLIDSEVDKGKMNIKVQSFGIKQQGPYFQQQLNVVR